MLFLGSADDLIVLGWESKIDPEAKRLIVCGTRRIDTLRLWLDATRDFLVVRVVLGVTEIRIKYSEDADHVIVPEEWTLVQLTREGEERRVITCRVRKIELNSRIPPSVFDFRFPPGTRVWDEKDRPLIVNASGKLVPTLPVDTQDGQDGVQSENSNDDKCR